MVGGLYVVAQALEVQPDTKTTKKRGMVDLNQNWVIVDFCVVLAVGGSLSQICHNCAATITFACQSFKCV